MSSSSLLQSGIRSKVTGALEDILYEVTLVRESAGYDPDTARANPSQENIAGKGFVDEFERSLVEKGVVQRNDRKVLLLQETFTDADGNEVKPQPGDSIQARGEEYEVISVKQDPSQSIWEVQGRG